MRQRSVVTGGAGFIGSHVVEMLLARGDEVVVLDNLANGNRSNLPNHENLTFVEVDVSQFEEISPYFADVHSVFHLAALADIVPSIQNPLRYHEANVDGTVAVLEAARQAEVSRFIYTASSSCYGLPNQVPTPENEKICPMYPYALTKRLGEELALHWCQTYNLPTVSLRLFNVYGPRAKTTGTYGAVFGVFLAQKLAGKPFTVVGDGTQTRDFTYVTDVARAFLAAEESDLSGEVLNIGSGGTYSINELTTLLGGDVMYVPKRPGEPDCTYADTQKIERLLGWKAEVSFSEGVACMLKNIDQWREAPVWDIESISEATADWFRCLSAKI